MHLIFDIGGTKMRVGIAENFKTILKTVILPTPNSFADGMALFRDISKTLLENEKAEVVCGGTPGSLDKNKTMILNAPNLRGWSKKPLVKELRKIFKVPVYLENDAALAGLGEATFGAGVGKKIVAYLTISTGVGGCRIVNGKIDESSLGFEPGHQIVFLDKKAVTLENMVSGTAIEKKYGKKPYEIYDGEIWDNIAKDLAYSLNNIAVLWSPDIIILGGSMMKKIGIPVERVQYHLLNILKIFPRPPLIKKSKLGDLAGLYGALAHLNNKE